MPDFIITEMGVVYDTHTVREAKDVGISLREGDAFYVDEDDVSWPVIGVSFGDPGWCIGPVAEA